MRYLVALLAVTLLAPLARGDLALTLLGDTTPLRGLVVAKDSVTSKPVQPLRYLSSDRQRITINLPNGSTLALFSAHTAIDTEAGWINRIECSANRQVDFAIKSVTAAQAMGYLDDFLSNHKLQLQPDDQKKWEAFKTSAASKSNVNDTFQGILHIPDWTRIDLHCEIRKNNNAAWITITGQSNYGLDLTPLPAGGWEIPGTRPVFSPDSKTLTDGRAVYEVATGKKLGELNLPRDEVVRARGQREGWANPPVVFSKDGQRIAIGSIAGRVRIFSVPDYTLTATLEVPNLANENKGTHGLAFSPDGQTLYVLADGICRALDSTNGAERRRFERSAASPDFNIALSHDGKTLATTFGKGEVALYNTADAKLLGVLRPKPAPPGTRPSDSDFDYHDPQFSVDDTRLMAPARESITIWSVKTSAVLRRLPTEYCYNASFSSDQRYYVVASAGDPYALYLHDAQTGAVMGAARPLAFSMGNAAFSPDDRYIAVTRYDINARTLVLKTAVLAAARPGPLPPQPRAKSPLAPTAQPVGLAETPLPQHLPSVEAFRNALPEELVKADLGPDQLADPSKLTRVQADNRTKLQRWLAKNLKGHTVAFELIVDGNNFNANVATPTGAPPRFEAFFVDKTPGLPLKVIVPVDNKSPLGPQLGGLKFRSTVLVTGTIAEAGLIQNMALAPSLALELNNVKIQPSASPPTPPARNSPQ
ncbi:MAG: WD40 repeat domain-containing protein [Phycisphaerae bacterium]